MLTVMRVRKKPKANQDKTGTQIPASAVIYGYATIEEVDGVRQVHVHGRGGRYTSLLAKKGAREAVLPGATFVGVPPTEKYVAWDGEGKIHNSLAWPGSERPVLDRRID